MSTNGLTPASATSSKKPHEVSVVKVVLQYFEGCPNWKQAEAHIETLRAEGYNLVVDR